MMTTEDMKRRDPKALNRMSLDETLKKARRLLESSGYEIVKVSELNQLKRNSEAIQDQSAENRLN